MKPRISMRTVLWLVALVAILAAWMADRRRLQVRHQIQLSEEITKANDRATMRVTRHALQLERWYKEMAHQAELRRQKKTPRAANSSGGDQEPGVSATPD